MPPIGVINHSNNSSPSITSTAIVNVYNYIYLLYIISV